MNIRENHGITLVMLIVTIVVLLILSGITISAITGGESTMDKASQAKNENEIKAEMEKLQEIINNSATKGIRHGNFSGSADATIIRSALKKNNLIVENPDDVIIDGQSEWIVTGNKTNTQYAIQSNGEVIRLIDTGSIKVGDIVNYTPSGTYNWDAEYATSYTAGTTEYNNANKTLDSSTNDFKITTWKVLNVDRKTGNIELVPSRQTIGEVTLHGAQGYNNGVKMLNDACSNLYSDFSKNITARSIKEEDFLKAGGKEWENYRNSFNNEYAVYGHRMNYTYSRKKYPIIYANEVKSVIDEMEKSNGLKQSEQNELIKRTDYGATLGRLEATNNIQPYLTYYNTNNYNKTLELLNDYSNILLANRQQSKYWVATRCVRLANVNSDYRINCIIYEKFNAQLLMGSDGPYYKALASLFPIIFINYNLLEETETSGTYNVK